MIIVNLKGGIGNQMFQYALGRKLSLQNNGTLKLDVFGLDRANKIGDIYRPFALDAFTIQADTASAEEIRRLKYPYGIFSKLMRGFRSKVLRKHNTGWHPYILKKTGDLYLDGFWQSPKYFADIRDTLLKDFTLRNPLSPAATKYAQMIQGSTSVSIHVRRGDYAANPRVAQEFGLCTKTYYARGIQEVESRASELQYFIFSDDVPWVKENLPLPQSAVFVKDATISDVEELVLMSMCTHNIIANSSFSWWAAWLGQNTGKVVVAPTPWFNIKQKEFAHIIPDSWIQIPKQ